MIQIFPFLLLSKDPQKYVRLKIGSSHKKLIELYNIEYELYNNYSPRLIIDSQLYKFRAESSCTLCGTYTETLLFHFLGECILFQKLGRIFEKNFNVIPMPVISGLTSWTAQINRNVMRHTTSLNICICNTVNQHWEIKKPVEIM